MFFLGSLRTWMKQLLWNKGCEGPYIPSALLITLFRSGTVPFRCLDRMWSTPLIRKTAIGPPPVLIIGHWRSGTTFLHNLLSLDQSMAYLTTMRSIAPEISSIKGLVLKRLIRGFIPLKRPMDNLPLSADAPQEDEFALTNMTGVSFYNAWMFPRNARYYFNKFGVLEQISTRELDLWKQTYLKLAKKIAMIGGGRRLILKNPVNTGRIAKILEVFPDAKFIYLVRNPRDVFPSTLNLHQKMLQISRLQTVSMEEIKSNVLFFYEKLLKKYLLEKHLIPEGNLVEVRFENLEHDPLSVLQNLYETLGLPDFHKTEPSFRRHIALQSGYRKNQYVLDPFDAKRIQKHWGFALDHWGYERKCLDSV